jgi:hypothetical protein
MCVIVGDVRCSGGGDGVVHVGCRVLRLGELLSSMDGPS